MSADQTADPVVDEAPLSPIRDRKNTLEHALTMRPDPQALLDRHILHAPPGVPVTVQQAQHDLEKSMTRDSLKSHLTKRPSRETLVQRNILSESTAAPTIQAGLRELERSMVQDSLKEKLLHRPAPEAVVERGILSPEEDPTKA